MKSILFVSCAAKVASFDEDISFQSRCVVPATELKKHGWNTEVAHVSKVNIFAKKSIVVFHCPADSIAFRKVFFMARMQGALLVADLDELNFDFSWAQVNPSVLNHTATMNQIEAELENHRSALRKFRRFTVATSPLAAAVKRTFPQAVVAEIGSSVPDFGKHFSEPVTDPVITFFSGDMACLNDWAVVAPVLQEFLFKHPEVRLHVYGDIYNLFQARVGQVFVRSDVSFSHLGEFVVTGRVNIAPMAMNPFNECLPAYSLILAGSHGIPTICSPLPDAERFDGTGVLVAHSASEWTSLLEKMLLDEEAYRLHTSDLRDRFLRTAGPAQSASLWMKQLFA